MWTCRPTPLVSPSVLKNSVGMMAVAVAVEPVWAVWGKRSQVSAMPTAHVSNPVVLVAKEGSVAMTAAAVAVASVPGATARLQHSAHRRDSVPRHVVPIARGKFAATTDAVVPAARAAKTCTATTAVNARTTPDACPTASTSSAVAMAAGKCAGIVVQAPYATPRNTASRSAPWAKPAATSPFTVCAWRINSIIASATCCKWSTVWLQARSACPPMMGPASTASPHHVAPTVRGKIVAMTAAVAPVVRAGPINSASMASVQQSLPATVYPPTAPVKETPSSNVSTTRWL